MLASSPEEAMTRFLERGNTLRDLDGGQSKIRMQQMKDYMFLANHKKAKTVKVLFMARKSRALSTKDNKKRPNNPKQAA